MAAKVSVTPSRQRIAQARRILLDHEDCRQLQSAGLLRAFVVNARHGWKRMESARLFHSLFLARRGQFMVKDALELEPGFPRILDPAMGGIIFARTVVCGMEAIGDHPQDHIGNSHEIIRLSIDAELITLTTSAVLPLIPSRQLADALSGLSLASFDSVDEHVVGRQAWITAAVSALRACWQGIGLEGGGSRINADLRALLARVNEMPDFPWDVSEMAKQLGCSCTHVGRRFAQAGLSSPMHEVQEIRMRRAERFLRFSDRNQVTIARICGFANIFSFSRAFSRRFGCSPSAYRRQSR